MEEVEEINNEIFGTASLNSLVLSESLASHTLNSTALQRLIMQEKEGSAERVALKVQLDLLNKAGKSASSLYKADKNLPELSESATRWSRWSNDGSASDVFSMDILTPEEIGTLNIEVKRIQEAMLNVPRKSHEKVVLKLR